MRFTTIFLKDLKAYYMKAPVVSWGILFPVTVIALLSFNVRVFGASRVVPAMFSISLLFASTSMAQVAVSFEKLSGAMQRILYLPVTGLDIILAKSLGGIVYGLAGTSIAAASVYLLLHGIPIIRPAYFAFGLVLGAILYSLLGVMIALYYEPVKAVAVLNIVRFSMVFLGGILFPKALLPKALAEASLLFPSVYVTEVIRFGMYNTWDYVDPYTSIIIASILVVALAYASSRMTLKILTP